METPTTQTLKPTSLLEWIRSDSRLLGITAAFGASLALNVANVIPFLGPMVDFVGDVGFETLALIIAASVVKGDVRPLRALAVFGGLGILKTAFNGLNLVPELGSLIELCTELGIDITQIWFLREILARRR